MLNRDKGQEAGGKKESRAFRIPKAATSEIANIRLTGRLDGITRTLAFCRFPVILVSSPSGCLELCCHKCHTVVTRRIEITQEVVRGVHLIKFYHAEQRRVVQAEMSFHCLRVANAVQRYNLASTIQNEKLILFLLSSISNFEINLKGNKLLPFRDHPTGKRARYNKFLRIWLHKVQTFDYLCTKK